MVGRKGVYREYGLQRLWELVSAPRSVVSPALASLAMDALIRSLSLPQARDHVQTYFARCVTSMHGGTATFEAPHILHMLLRGFPEATTTAGSKVASSSVRSRGDIMEALLAEHGSLVRLAIVELHRYTSAANAVAAARGAALARLASTNAATAATASAGGHTTTPAVVSSDGGTTAGAALARCVVVGRSTHAESLRQRLQFLAFLTTQGTEELTFDNVKTVANACCSGKLGAGGGGGGGGVFFRWLHHMCFKPTADAAVARGAGGSSALLPAQQCLGLPKSVVERVFREFLCPRLLSPTVLSTLDVAEFACFEVRWTS